MHICAVPFDLRLWTGIDDEPVSEEHVYTRFSERRDRVIAMNLRLSDHPTLRDCLLRIPLTERIFEHLCNIPSWSEVRRGSYLYRFKTSVLALLRNRQDAAGVTLYLDTRDVDCLYTWQDPQDFFPAAPAVIRDEWVEMTGLCAFEPALTVRESEYPLPVLATWIITTYSMAAEARLACHTLEGELVGERQIPLLFQADISTWERRVRQSLWQDERLPFNGPNGPFGYYPTTDWRPGERPRRHQNAYLDALGGLWEWESGRAMSERNPFGGHWNVQLPDASTRRRWVDYLQDRSGQIVQTRADVVTHINVEPDGSIVDITFTWSNERHGR